ncbi:hypothetical protein P8X24_11600 [Pyrococcus kukulkanii]|uniref:hypothetical protein n=1 Tax=Pyrococcus kukulkanii TaxID=1609559 RepID=UPI00356B39C1
MKRLFIPILLIILGIPGALGYYSWTGSLDPGTIFYVNNLTAKVDRDIAGNRSIVIVGDTYIFEGEKKTVEGLTFEVKTFNTKTYVTITSEEPFEIVFSRQTSSLQDKEKYEERIRELEAELENATEKIKTLEEENEKLKQKIRELAKNSNSNVNFNELQLKLLNLTRENRELKEKLANVTNKLNYIKAENEYLKEQLKMYQEVFSGMISRVEQHAESNYIEQAKKSEKSAKRLWGTLILSGMLVGGFGLLLYRKKRKYFYE